MRREDGWKEIQILIEKRRACDKLNYLQGQRGAPNESL